jgi:hypothetical protein
MPGSSHGHDADVNEDREHDKLCHRRRARSERVQPWYLQNACATPTKTSR